MMKKLILLLNISGIFLLAGCKKETVPGNPSGSEAVLSVALNNQYMDGSKIDSAIAVWELNGQQKTVKMQLQNDKLTTDINQFQAGNGKLSVHVFSKVKFGTYYSSQWVQQKQLSLERNKAVNLDGPTGFNDLNWSPRVMLKDGAGHSAVIALRPDDPYFYIKDVQDDVLELVAAREYWNKVGIIKVAGGEWHCTAECRDEKRDVVNTTFFNFLPQQIGTRQWNHIEITVFYRNDNNGGFVLSMNMDLN